jgi:hypothetical protein
MLTGLIISSYEHTAVTRYSVNINRRWLGQFVAGLTTYAHDASLDRIYLLGLLDHLNTRMA